MLSDENKILLVWVGNAMQRSKYTLPYPQMWENPYGRLFESELFIQLLNAPTQKMMAVVGLVSKEIIKIIDEESEVWTNLSFKLSKTISPYLCGTFDNVCDRDEIKNILNNNAKNDLMKIMLIHYCVTHSIRSCSKNEKFVKKITEIADDAMYESDYYSDRGRDGKLKNNTTSLLGILHPNQKSYNTNHSYPDTWIADSKSQAPSYQSNYVIKLLNNDVPYVSGPSGMTSLLVAQMLTIADTLTHEQKEAYIVSIATYLVSTGCHSLHEILGPLRVCIPEEKLAESYDEQTMDFNSYFLEMQTIDPEFIQRKEAAYSAINGYMKAINFETDKQYTLESLIELLNTGFLESVKNYQNRPKGFLYKINPQKAVGVNRAGDYADKFADCNTLRGKLEIAHKLLSDNDGPTLKLFVTNHMRFPNVTETEKWVGALMNCTEASIEKNNATIYEITQPIQI
ncbi:MAG: hypothetical protein KDH94_01460 [Coxiellaceae bacterium]|nr:hypothetical protein [Coxiellaceae bacterium]